MADQPPVVYNPYNPWGSYVSALTSGVDKTVDKALAPPTPGAQKGAAPATATPGRAGYAKGVSRVGPGQTRLGMLRKSC